MEKAIRNYWWRGSEQRKGLNWISWERLMRQKKNGGLGFRDIQCFNLAFLAKIGWRLIHQPGSLLAIVLKEKYFPGSSYLKAPKGRNTSWGWKGIFDARKVLVQGLRWRVGNGRSIHLRDDPWIPRPSTFKARPRETIQCTKVSDLINPELCTWRTEMITDGFHQDDVTPILCIPLSRLDMCDRLIWHYNTNGEYSVKSGYGLAVRLMENGELGRKGRGMPSDCKKNSFEWNIIWKLHVPNKIKIFVWKCCNHALAVRQNLQRRSMRVDNVCGVCNQVGETENHLFFHCDISHKFWFCSPLHLDSHSFVGRDFRETWMNFCKRVQDSKNAEEILQEFAFGLWRLWKNRNENVFNGISRQPMEMVQLWNKSVMEFREAMVSPGDGKIVKALQRAPTIGSLNVCWKKPAFGTMKVNTDAAWCKESLRVGAGWVCRDFAGLLHAAGGSGEGWSHSAAAAEAYAIREALFACIDNGYDKIVIESDAKLIIQMLRKEMPWDYSLECLLGDIEILARRVGETSFSFTPREGNCAAHLVAKYFQKEGGSYVWDCVGPEFLFNTLARDVNIPIRI